MNEPTASADRSDARADAISEPRATIFALASGRPPAAIAVIRISGPRSHVALQALIGRVPKPRQATLARVRDPQTREEIDQALVLWFPAPASETGEDVAELQLHGGRAVIAAILTALGRLEDCRMAEAGEFTRRAFENGRLDLTQVEALADLVYAETAAQRRQALAQVTGLLGSHAERWRHRLIEARALIEAGIDFADEGDVAKDTLARAAAIIAPLLTEVDAALRSAIYGERLREGLRVAILGPPNAGKSTLFNRLAQREAAIVSPHPGTTRDVIEVHLELAGYPVTLLDTAGIRENTEDPIEREGMRRARDAAAGAHLVLWLEDAETLDALAVWKAEHEPRGDPGMMRWLLVSKIDRISADELAGHKAALRQSRWTIHYVSAADGSGIDALVESITTFAQNFFPAEPALVTRERQHVIVRQVSSALHAAMSRIAHGGGEEIIAEDLRHAATHLGRLTGRVDVEEVLDVIFREFCIGK